MTTYAEGFELVNDSVFGKRVQMALWIGCVAILANGGASAGAKTFAKNQLKGQADSDLGRRMGIRCAASGLTRDSTDAEIQAVIDTMIAELVA